MKYFKPVWVWLPPYALTLFILVFSKKRMIDDAYIAFRYSAQLVNGHGLVLNPGEHVEGFSSFFWTILHCLPIWLDIPIEPFTYILGLAFGTLTFFLTKHLLEQLEIPEHHRFFTLLAFALYLPFWYSITMGLEGGLYAFALVGLVYLCLQTPTNTNLFLLAVLSALLWLIRPEGLGIGILVALYNLHRTRRLPFFALFATIVLATVAVRYAYYGEVIPNTLIAKTNLLRELDHPELAKSMFEEGFEYVYNFFKTPEISLACSLGLFLFTSKSRLWLMGVIPLYLAVIAILGAGDWMPKHRLLTPAIPIIMLMAATGLQYVPIRLRKWATVFWVVFVVFSLVHHYRRIETAQEFTKIHSIPCYDLMGKTLNNLKENDPLVATTVLGVVGYHAPDLRIHDMFGLADSVVAHTGEKRPRQGALNMGYTYSLHPDVMIFDHQFEYYQQELSRYGYPDGYYVFEMSNCGHDAPPPVIAVREDRAPEITAALSELIDLVRIGYPKETADT